MALTAEVTDWASARGISRPTLEAFGVAGGTKVISGHEDSVIAFPYRRGGDLVNVKYRALSTKDFWQKQDGEQRFFNLDAALEGAGDIAYVVEGEIDALSLHEAGLPIGQILSVPGGAPAQENEDPFNETRYRFVLDGLEEGLSRVRRFVIATDNDAPGRALRNDLVRLFGLGRCAFIEWPDGIKDANEFILARGADALPDFLRQAQQEFPLPNFRRLSAVPERPPMTLWRPGFPEWESKLQFGSRCLSVITGQPGHGKTTMALQLWHQIARDYGIQIAFASYETFANPEARRVIRQFYSGTQERNMTDDETAAADQWIDEHFFWADDDRFPTIHRLLSDFEALVVRHNVKALVIDPWNKLEASKPDRMPETEWIGRCLDEIRTFAVQMNVHIQILAHPAKVDSTVRHKPPQLSDIAGSKHWDNKVDHGLCVFRPKTFEEGVRQTEAQLIVLKTRFNQLGHPCRLNVDYDIGAERYVSTDYRQAHE